MFEATVNMVAEHAALSHDLGSALDKREEQQRRLTCFLTGDEMWPAVPRTPATTASLPPRTVSPDCDPKPSLPKLLCQVSRCCHEKSSDLPQRHGCVTSQLLITDVLGRKELLSAEHLWHQCIGFGRGPRFLPKVYISAALEAQRDSLTPLSCPSLLQQHRWPASWLIRIIE